KNQEEFEKILSRLWDKILDTPEIVESIGGVKIIALFRYTDYPSALYIDNTGEKPRYYWNPKEKIKADVEMILSSETSHKFWMEDLNVPMAIAGRKIIPKGSVQKALKLIPALKPAFAIYPIVLKEFGRDDLLEKAVKAKGKKRASKFSFTDFFRKKELRPDVLPVFPLTFDGGRRAAGPVAPGKSLKEVSDRDLLKTMCVIRAFEEHLALSFKEGKLPTEAIHLSIGQEAVAAGVCMNLRNTDYLNTTHRGHGHIIAKGADLNRMMAELYGKANGLCAGKGGSMHVTDGTCGVLGANGIVGAGYLLAMGAGLTIKCRKRDDISVVIAGDGSVNQGMFHEAMNMIAVFNLPVLVVVENNLYGEFTSLERHSAVTEIYKRAAAYGIESMRLNGNDVKEVYLKVGDVIRAMRQDGKPRLMELMTYRWHGHMEGDPELYRDESEKEAYRCKDPIPCLIQEMLDGKTASPAEIESIRKAAVDAVNEAIAFAAQAAEPKVSALLEDVYTPEDRVFFTGSITMSGTGTKEVSMSQAINEAIAEEMARDDSVFLWGEDVTLGGYFNVTEGLVERFGRGRIIDTPISEYGIIGGAVGAAMTGMRPIAEILFSDFLTCCMDPIINQAAKLRYMTGGQVSIPLTIRTPVGSGVGVAAQHSQSMEKFLFGVPGLMVVAPSDVYTAKGLLKSAIRINNPVIFFEHKLMYAEAGKIPVDEYTLPLGKAVIKRSGEDITIVTHLLGVKVALEAAGMLERDGISVEVIDLCTLYPMDTETILQSVKKTGRLVTVEEGTCTGGIGAEVIARIATAGFGILKAAPVRIAAPECPIPYAKILEAVMMPSPDAIAGEIRKIL
ncbi:MAG: dehydrogenase E1 component subunit alpha/beta, partial [Deltaproteobacteria bacterium]|nr:dehydrogenase E1 component subunit alpha/beta [Deltaproteobacteria bacterium]